MSSELQKLLERLTGGRSAEVGGSSQASTETAGAPTDETMKVEVEESPFPEAERIAASIRDFPDDWAWRHKGYELQHVPTGFTMWVANKEFALAEVYSTGGKGKFSKSEQAIIWPAVETWLARHKVGFSGRLPKATIIGRDSTYWCFIKDHPWVGVGSSPVDAYRTWSFAISAQARNNMSPTDYLKVWSAAR